MRSILPSGEVIDVPGARILWDAAGTPSGRHEHEGQDPIRADCLHPFNRELEVGTSVIYVGEEAADAIGPLVHACDLGQRG